MTHLKVINPTVGEKVAPIRQRKSFSSPVSSATTHRQANHLEQGASTHPIQAQLVQTHRSLEQIYRLERPCLS